MLVQIHLAINHLPVLGIAFSLILFAYALLRNAKEIKIVALLAYLICLLFVFPTYLSGEKAEDLVEKLPGVTETAIEKHENLAKPALALAVVGMALGVVVLFSIYSDFKTLTWLPYVLLVFMLVQNLYFLNLAHSGGLIRHTELAPGKLPQAILQEKAQDRD
jgi:Ca2+/Na+ antiporter